MEWEKSMVDLLLSMLIWLSSGMISCVTPFEEMVLNTGPLTGLDMPCVSQYMQDTPISKVLSSLINSLVCSESILSYSFLKLVLSSTLKHQSAGRRRPKPTKICYYSLQSRARGKRDRVIISSLQSVDSTTTTIEHLHQETVPRSKKKTKDSKMT